MCNEQHRTNEIMKLGKNTSYVRNLFTDTGLFALSSFGSRFLILFLAPLYTYVLTTEEFGTVDLLQATVTFYLSFVDPLHFGSCFAFCNG